MRIRKRIYRLLISAVMIVGIAGSSGCGRTGDAVFKNGEGAENAGVSVDSGKAMGRYVELVNPALEDRISAGSRIRLMNDGSLAVFDRHEGMLVSKDNGETWEEKALAWHEELASGAYIMDVALSADGYIGVIYEEYSQAAGEEEPETEAEAEKTDSTVGKKAEEAEAEAETAADAAADTAEDEAEEGLEMAENVDFTLHPRCLVAAPDGSLVDVLIPDVNGEYLQNLYFSDDGRLFASALGGQIYEIDKTEGSYELVTELADWVFYLSVQDNIMLCENTEGITLFDLDKGEVIEDETLDDFIESEFGGKLEFVNMTAVPILVLPEDDNIVYLVCEKGIYRHVIGGSMIEQLTDGALTVLNDPAYQIMDGMLLEDGAFQILFWGGTLITYTYDPDMPTLPDIQVKAYSLEENYTLKRAISQYQSGHPEVYIKYETGMDNESSMTREDALKKLNTEIAAGNGPDIMILDNMPIESYINKGILADLAVYLEDINSEEYFTNILNSYQSDAGTYLIPMQFRLLLMAGDSSRLAQMDSLEGAAEIIEQCRREKPEGSLLGIWQEKQVLANLIPLGLPDWKRENGEADKAALVDFFTAAKQLWDAENAGITEEMRADYEESVMNLSDSTGMPGEEISQYRLQMGSAVVDYAAGKQDFVIGSLSDSMSFDTLLSSFKIKGRTTGDYAAVRKNGKGVFIPETFAGISSTSEYQEIAGEVLKIMLKGEVTGGFCVNKAEWKERLSINATEDGTAYGSIGVAGNEDDIEIVLDIYPAAEEAVDRLMQTADSVTVPYVREPVVEDAILEIGERVLRGEITAEMGSEEVIKKIAIYMAE